MKEIIIPVGILVPFIKIIFWLAQQRNEKLILELGIFVQKIKIILSIGNNNTNDNHSYLKC